MKTEYIPGTCNIGPAEIKARKSVAIYSAILSVVLIFILLHFDAPKLWRILLFIPATSAGVSFQQWYSKFCVKFGMQGVFNFGDLGKTHSVLHKEYFKKDRNKALKMITIGMVFGVIMAALFYLIP